MLILLWFASNPHLTDVTSTEQILPKSVLAHPSNKDNIIVQVTASAPPQQSRLLLAWVEDGRRRHTVPVTDLISEQSQTIIVPVGVHPGWRGTVSDLRLVAPFLAGSVQVERVQRVQGPRIAPERWLLQALHPVLPILPPYAHMQLFVGVVLGAGLALTIPWSHWRRRLALFGIVVSCSVGGMTIAAQVQVLQAVIPAYGAVSDARATAQAPPYEADAQAIAQLVAIADELPAGPVLLLDVRPVSDLLHRARYLLYPRRVDVRSPQHAPGEIPQVLNAQYVAAIQVTPTSAPPAPGWERINSTAGPLAIWQAPGLPPAALRPAATWPTAALPLFGGLMFVFLLGWAGAVCLGWRGVLAWSAAWPIGTALLAWWMWLLDILSLPWSWWSIGLPLVLTAVVAVVVAHRRTNLIIPTSKRDWSSVGWIVVVALTVGVAVQAMLLPFTDRDTWAMWGLKGQAFYLDGGLEPVLTMYRGIDVHHTSYPPAQPLSQTWLYLMMGGISERLVKVIFPLWYLTGIVLTWWICRRWSTPLAAIGWALLLATTPLYLDHATLGNADLPLAVTLVLGGIALACWVESGERSWILGGAVALGAAAWIKLDGNYLGAGMLLAALLVRLRAQWPQRRRTSTHVVLAGALFVALILPWTISTQIFNLNDVPSLETLQQDGWARLGEGLVVLGAEVLFSYNNSSMGLLGGGYGVFWFICLGCVILGWRRLRDDPVLWFLLLVVAGGFAVYLAAYTVRPYYSVDRYLLHLAPLALVAAARASRGACSFMPPPAPVPVSMPASPRAHAGHPVRRTQRGRKR
ncbi:MAG: hypothetical protein HC828_09365 [Blastochloris sp.]|nr:hypothetical protein [Blastochloris sp.]